MTSEGDSRVTDDLGAGAEQGNGIGVLIPTQRTKEQSRAMTDLPKKFQMLKENRTFLGDSLVIAIFI